MADTFARQRTLIGTTAEWQANDLVIGYGEVAIEVTGAGSMIMKIGDGAQVFSALPFLNLNTSGVPTDVATAVAQKLSISGGTLTGPLVLNAAPAADNEAATKKWTEDTITAAIAAAGGGGGGGGLSNIISRQLGAGSGNYVVPTATTFVGIRARLWGNGGRGGQGNSNRGSAGGGGGGYCEGFFDAASLTNAQEAYTVQGANSGQLNSTFLTLIAQGGGNANGTIAGTGGTGSGGQININGQDGQATNDNATARLSGQGGGSFSSQGGMGGYSSGDGGGELVHMDPQPGMTPGGGGGGNSETSNAGASGGDGMLLIDEYYVS